jgi:hypothetical protein
MDMARERERERMYTGNGNGEGEEAEASGHSVPASTAGLASVGLKASCINILRPRTKASYSLYSAPTGLTAFVEFFELHSTLSSSRAYKNHWWQSVMTIRIPSSIHTYIQACWHTCIHTHIHLYIYTPLEFVDSKKNLKHEFNAKPCSLCLKKSSPQWVTFRLTYFEDRDLVIRREGHGIIKRRGNNCFVEQNMYTRLWSVNVTRRPNVTRRLWTNTSIRLEVDYACNHQGQSMAWIMTLC